MFFKKSSPEPQRRTRNPRPSASLGAVFSYHANRSVREGGLARDASGRQQEQLPRPGGLRLWLKRLPAFGAVVLTLASLSLGLRLTNEAKVVPLSADKSHVFLRDMSVYTAAAQKAFKPMLNSNKLTVNTEKIAADLKRQFPELKAVSVSLPFFGSQPVVYVQPATPQLILVSGQGVFLLDSSGRALISANQVAKLNAIDVPVITDQSNLKIEEGQIALPRKTMSFIGEVFGQLRAQGLAPSSFVLPPGTNELHVRLQGAGYYTRYNLHGNAREEAGAFLAAKTRLEAEHKTPREYVDVRVENKVYYR